MKRLALAFLAAPLLPAVLQAVLVETQYHSLAIFVVACAIMYVLELIVLMLAGWLFLSSYDDVQKGLLALGWFGLLGVATTAGFWFIARPDRRVAST